MPKMTVVFVGEQAPRSYRQSLFLAGPTPRVPDVLSWRPEALQILTRHMISPFITGPYTSLAQ